MNNKKFERENLSNVNEQLNSKAAVKIKLNVGGMYFTTTLTTLQSDPNSTLSKMFSGSSPIEKDDDDGAYFIDRDGRVFGHILTWLRTGKLSPALSDEDVFWLKEEADYYQLLELSKSLLEHKKEYYELHDLRHQLDEARKTLEIEIEEKKALEDSTRILNTEIIELKEKLTKKEASIVERGDIRNTFYAQLKKANRELASRLDDEELIRKDLEDTKSSLNKKNAELAKRVQEVEAELTKAVQALYAEQKEHTKLKAKVKTFFEDK